MPQNRAHQTAKVACVLLQTTLCNPIPFKWLIQYQGLGQFEATGFPPNDYRKRTTIAAKPNIALVIGAQSLRSGLERVTQFASVDKA